MSIIIKTDEEITAMRQAGRIVATILEILRKRIKPGMETRELDSIADLELKGKGAKSSFKGYRDFPANLCVSVNDEIVHGIPGKNCCTRVILSPLILAPSIRIFRLMRR